MMADAEGDDRALPLPIFVYGTLRPGDIGFVEAGLEGRIKVLGPARVAGRLYDLGDYPGAVLGDTGTIIGDLLVPLDDELLPILDEYELYDPADPKRSEYLRVEAKTLDDDLNVWIYAYNRSVTDMPVITGGDWTKR